MERNNYPICYIWFRYLASRKNKNGKVASALITNIAHSRGTSQQKQRLQHKQNPQQQPKRKNRKVGEQASLNWVRNPALNFRSQAGHEVFSKKQTRASSLQSHRPKDWSCFRCPWQDFWYPTSRLRDRPARALNDPSLRPSQEQSLRL